MVVLGTGDVLGVIRFCYERWGTEMVRDVDHNWLLLKGREMNRDVDHNLATTKLMVRCGSFVYYLIKCHVVLKLQ